ncbi:MAG: protein-L-isoaspartate O-methyltransferase family protein [Candidatus Njordarchaeales archaeon]
MRCKARRQIPEDLRKKLQEDKKDLYEFFKRIKLVSDRVLRAFLRVPREEFVLPKYLRYAYVDEPLPLMDGATISAISMSLLLCEYAGLKEGDEVLEIGTGSGYQAALIAEIVCEKNQEGEIIECKEKKPVCTIEISERLYRYAKENLERLCYTRCIEIIHGDGTLGWPDTSRKFDAIIVTAAGDQIPPPLIKQLKVGGKLIMPLGKGFWQDLIRVTKKGEKEDDILIEKLEPVRFVYLKGVYGVEK